MWTDGEYVVARVAKASRAYGYAILSMPCESRISAAVPVGRSSARS